MNRAYWLALIVCVAGVRPALAQGDRSILTPLAQKAIERGLASLARTQNADGSWGGQYQVANTALPLMAFMVRGHFPDRGEYGKVLGGAVNYLIAMNRREQGYMAASRQGMYEHALATLALSEVWGESQRDDIRDALIDAVGRIVEAQHPLGGWRYSPAPTDHDISVTAMQIVALASAREAGVFVPQEVMNKARAYVMSCQDRGDGGFMYQPGQRGTEFARSAAGVMSLLITDRRDSPEAQRGLRYLEQNGPASIVQCKYYYYAHYYAMQCMYQAGEPSYVRWYPQIRDELIRRQRTDGSWTGGQGGEPYSTSMAILVLGVPYRFLPIYQR